MFAASTYVARRARLAEDLGSGLALFPGSIEVPMNYTDNAFPFRQDSAFLYFWGIDMPDVAAVLDVDARRETLYGDDFTLDDIVWRGPQPRLADRAAAAGIPSTAPREALRESVREAVRKGRPIHFLPPYRADTTLALSRLTGIAIDEVPARASLPLIRATVAQRMVKSAEEIAELEDAIETTGEMHLQAMRLARPGVHEREVAGAMEGLVVSRGRRLAFPTIFSVHGETLHNHAQVNVMAAGQMAVNDSGAESPLHYAGDITRTIPIGGRFSGVRREIYEAVLHAQSLAIEAIGPGVPYRDVHLLASRSLAESLIALGCLRGDPDEAVAAGAHALFFPHGLGHAIGLDVHDMESLGEDHVGYDETVVRSDQFGLRSLRFGRALQRGFVVTVEPGLYFIPALIDRWQAEGRCAPFVDYRNVERLKDAGGVRIEDNVAVTDKGCRVLGPPIPKSIDEVEALARS